MKPTHYLIMLIRYNILNDENKIIGSVVAPTLAVASAKLKHKMPTTWPFVRLEQGETVYLNKREMPCFNENEEHREHEFSYEPYYENFSL